MALSNLIWWPWFGKHTPFIPPVVTGDNVMGGLLSQAEAQARASQRGQQATLKRRRLEEDDDEFGFLLTEL